MVFGLKAAICTTLACACTPIRFNISVALTITRSSIDYLISHEGRIKNHVAALHIGSLSRENDFVPVKVLHRPPRVWPIGHLEVSKGRKMGVSTQIIRQCRAADRLGSEPFFNELYFFFFSNCCWWMPSKAGRLHTDQFERRMHPFDFYCTDSYLCERSINDLGVSFNVPAFGGRSCQMGGSHEKEVKTQGKGTFRTSWR